MYSKTVLLLIEGLGLGSLGIDRLYMNCPATGSLKFMLFLLVALFWYVDETIFNILAFAWFFWVLFDYISVFVNAFLSSPYNPFCNKIVYYSDNDVAPIFAIFLILVDFTVLAICGYSFFGPFSLFQ